MTAINKDKTEHLIAQFLTERDHPTTEDWKALVDQYPQHASAIADAAMVRAAGDAADAADDPFVFDVELANRTVSKALNRVHQMPSRNLEIAQHQMNSLKGVARKEAAEKLGIGPYPALLNGVLSGRTQAPVKLLQELAAFFDVQMTALAELFRRNFAATPVPAFKAGNSKPQVAAEPASWEDAVRALKLSSEETSRLLAFSDDC